MTNDIKEIVSTLYIQAERDELRHRFPVSDREEVARLYRDTEEVWHEYWPNDELVEALMELTEEHGRYNFKLTKSTKLDETNIKIPDLGSYYVQVEADNQSSIRVKTYGDNEDRHYTRLDEVKTALTKEGFKLASGKCHITFLKEC